MCKECDDYDRKNPGLTTLRRLIVSSYPDPVNKGPEVSPEDVSELYDRLDADLKMLALPIFARIFYLESCLADPLLLMKELNKNGNVRVKVLGGGVGDMAVLKKLLDGQTVTPLPEGRKGPPTLEEINEMLGDGKKLPKAMPGKGGNA